VTRAVLALELYAIVARINIAILISTTLRIIIKQLKLPPILTIVCTDLFLLYKYIVKLRTTKEKCLIINIIAIRQSYERRELSKIR
jgi:hypothetical protein